MKIKIFVHKNHVDEFNDFYNKVNDGKIYEKSEIPILDVKLSITREEELNYAELLMYYDIYLAMKLVFIENKEIIEKAKLSAEKLDEFKEIEKTLTKAVQHNALTDVVKTALELTAEDISINKVDALSKAIEIWKEKTL